MLFYCIFRMLERNADAEFQTVGTIKEVGPHVETCEHLAHFFEFREMVSSTDSLKESAHIFCKTDSFECIYAACNMNRECIVVQILNQVD